MKKRCSIATLLIGAAIIAGITSCEKNVSTEGIQSTTPAGTTGRPGEGETTLKAYCMVKDNDNTLHYDYAKRLVKVTSAGTGYRQYEYGPNKITASWWNNSQKVTETVYRLDNNKRAIEAYTVYYNNGNTQTGSTYFYEYTGSGQLTLIFRKDALVDYASFHYNANGDLDRIDRSGITFGNSTTNLSYDYNDPETDKYGFNPEIPYIDTYLKIYGKFSKHLVKREQHKITNWYSTDLTYAYTRNAAGYVVKRNAFNTESSQYLNSEYYSYEWK